MDWTLSIKDEDGFVIFEADAVINFYLEWDDMGFPEVYVESFEIETSKLTPDGKRWERGKHPAIFSPESDSLWQRYLFLQVKEDLENDTNFTEWAVEHAESFGDCPPRRDPYEDVRLLPCELV